MADKAADAQAVLALGANPGDAELMAGGIVALLGKRGWRVVLASLSPGDKSGGGTAEEVSALRRKEASGAAAALGGEYLCLEHRELAIYAADTACRKTTALIRYVRPAVVITHSPLDAIDDRAQTCIVVRRACLAATNAAFDAPAFPRFEVPSPLAESPCLYYAEATGGLDAFGAPLSPQCAVDVMAVGALVEAALGAHHSQKTRWDWDARQALRELRGSQIGCETAEGLTPHRGPGLPARALIEQTLGPLVRPLTPPPPTPAPRDDSMQTEPIATRPREE